jgi:hypothetical protein
MGAGSHLGRDKSWRSLQTCSLFVRPMGGVTLTERCGRGCPPRKHEPHGHGPEGRRCPPPGPSSHPQPCVGSAPCPEAPQESGFLGDDRRGTTDRKAPRNARPTGKRRRRCRNRAARHHSPAMLLRRRGFGTRPFRRCRARAQPRGRALSPGSGRRSATW